MNMLSAFVLLFAYSAIVVVKMNVVSIDKTNIYFQSKNGFNFTNITNNTSNNFLKDPLITLKLNKPVKLLVPEKKLEYDHVRVEIPTEATYGYATFQVHSQYRLLVASSQEVSVHDKESIGSHAGFLLKLNGIEPGFDGYFRLLNNFTTKIMLLAVPRVRLSKFITTIALSY